MLTPQEILDRERSFSAELRGYNKTEVHKFLEEIADDFSSLYKETAALKAKMKVLVEKVEEYRATEDSMRATLMAAQRTAETIVTEAQQRRDQLMAQAEAEARNKIGLLRGEAESLEERIRRGKESLQGFSAAIRAVCDREMQFLGQLPQVMAAAPSAAPGAAAAREIQENLMASFKDTPAAPPVKAPPPAQTPVMPPMTAAPPPAPAPVPPPAAMPEFPPVRPQSAPPPAAAPAPLQTAPEDLPPELRATEFPPAAPPPAPAPVMPPMTAAPPPAPAPVPPPAAMPEFPPLSPSGTMPEFPPLSAQNAGGVGSMPEFPSIPLQSAAPSRQASEPRISDFPGLTGENDAPAPQPSMVHTSAFPPLKPPPGAAPAAEPEAPEFPPLKVEPPPMRISGNKGAEKEEEKKPEFFSNLPGTQDLNLADLKFGRNYGRLD